MSPKTFILIGRSGCGKGTQGKLLQEKLVAADPSGRVFYHEMGARFREFIQKPSHTSALSKAVYERDDRQPDFLAVWIWSDIFVENLQGDEHLFIDGTPRSLPEAQVLDTALNFYGRKAKVIFLNVSRDWSKERLLARGRFDDANTERINKRLDWFDRDVLPAVEYFKQNAISQPEKYAFFDINGEQPIEKVHADIIDELSPLV